MAIMFDPPHPGGILKEALEELHISARDFAKRIEVSPATISRFINEKSSVTPELALRIAQVMPGPSAETWLAMQADYDLWQAEHTLKKSLASLIPFSAHSTTANA